MRRIQTTSSKGRRHTIVCQGDSLTDPTANMGPEWTRWTEVLRQKLEGAGASVVCCNIGQSGAKTDDLGKNMLLRFTPFLRGTPDIGIIWGGTNDVRTISGITRSGTTATATSNGHAFANTALMDVFGANQADYNVSAAQIANVQTNTFDFTVANSPTTPATTASAFKCRLQTKLNLRAMLKWLKFGCLGCVRGQANLPADAQNGDRYVVLYDTSSTGGMAALAGQTAQLPGPRRLEIRRCGSAEGG